MSEALPLDAFEFDDAPRPGSEVPDATGTIRKACDAAGLDVPSSLYNEALVLARDGHLGQAAARLTMLLCLDPSDADALLLMAKVNAAQGRPSDALSRLEAAVEAGAFAPAGFREYLEAALRAERSRDEEARTRTLAREQGELRQLRAEARELRSENTRLEVEVTDSVYREKTWKYLSFGLGVLVVLVVVLFSFASRDPAPTVADAAIPVPAAPAIVDAAAPTEVTPAPVAPTASARPVVSPPKAASAPAAKPTPAAAAAKPTKGFHGSYTVQNGDTLGSLAARFYGDASQWKKIADANKKTLHGGKALSIGMKLSIP